MATGAVYRFAKRKNDNTIEGERLIIDSDGSLTKVNETIFTSESPVIPQNFTDEINALIQSGDIVIPEQDSLSMHIVDITDQLQAGKYTYNIVDANMLRDAQAHPENYSDLMIRVAGFTARWVELGPSAQDEIIKRTEYGGL